jgi:type I restriction enzyme M protein
LLDTDTKRRIDTARDILVGKVPDPKSQVEQITIALIYKFMDDMDAESEELGGKRKFFTGDHARFGWAKLMRSGLGGHEILSLYGEGISTMPANPGIPLLFRDIFKNAYLPYRDPETLKSFLKLIDEFSYDHSERLGDAFEYLLSVLGSQGDAGQFRTPRHIIDFMVTVVDPKKEETILDPACGTAGFLISSYKHMLRANSDAKGKVLLTPDEKRRLAQNIKGYDISPDMVRLSLANLYLHGFTDPHIHEYDTLTQEERWNELADVILANPPFMSPKGGIRPHRRFSVQSNRSEVLFVDYMVEHLSRQGRAGIIVPEGIIFQSGDAYRRLREVLLKEALIGVISLPSGVFQPYSGVKTSILILDKSIAKVRSNILFSEVQAIGVSLGIKRTITEQNDLPHVLADYAAYYAGGPLSSRSWLAERGVIFADECSLSGARYRPVEARGDSRVVRLGDVCILTKGSHSSTKSEPGSYPLIVTAEKPLTSSDYQIEGEAVCVPLISSAGHGRASLKRIHFATGRFAVANLLAALQPQDPKVLNAKYLYFILDFRKETMAGLMKGAANVSMKVEDLAQLQIPLPPLELQKTIVTEIEGYQKVINGARIVLDNYRPHIPIHPDWPILELGEVTAKITDGAHFTPTYTDTGVPFLRVTDITESNLSKKFIPQDEHDELIKRCHPEKGDVLYSKNGTIGVAKLIDWDWQFSIFVSLCLIKPKKELLDPQYLTCFLNSDTAYAQATARSKSGTVTNLHLVDIKTIKIPVPLLAVQQAIVAEIKTEHALVASNRELIARFERKIQATLARVWGENEPAETES